jgi:hypothetical protein
MTIHSNHSRTFIQEFVAEKTKLTDESQLPFLVPLAAHGHQYFVQRDLVAPVFLEKVAEAAREIHDHYLEDWITHLRRFERTGQMGSDERLRLDVEVLSAQNESGQLLSTQRLSENRWVIVNRQAKEVKFCFDVRAIDTENDLGFVQAYLDSLGGWYNGAALFPGH